MVVENCMKCPKQVSGCTFDRCHYRIGHEMCIEECDFMVSNEKRLKDLPDYCCNKNKLPNLCPFNK